MVKKKINMLYFWTIMLFFQGMGYAESVVSKSEYQFLLPCELIAIEEEAFAGTSVNNVILPDGFLYIGENAFAGNLELRDVYIPLTTEYIADTAFPGNTDMIVHGVEGSYAQEWSEKHQVLFVIDNIWEVLAQVDSSSAPNKLPNKWYVSATHLENLISVHRHDKYGRMSKRPQDRPELNSIDYRFP